MWQSNYTSSGGGFAGNAYGAYGQYGMPSMAAYGGYTAPSSGPPPPPNGGFYGQSAYNMNQYPIGIIPAPQQQPSYEQRMYKCI